jgi:hypothetical protein
MKKSIRISRVILLILTAFLIHSCEPEKPPVTSTASVTAISFTTATSGGEVTSDGGAAVTAKGVCWNTSADPTVANNKTADGTGVGSFTSSLTGLTAGTTYYVRAYATNTAGTGYGSQVTFTTNQIAVAVLTTTAITATTQTTATSGGNITADNGSPVTARGVCWSTSQNPTTANSKTTDASGTGSFTSSITGLTPGATYYVRAYATNSVGTAYGNQITLTALANLPTITTTSLTVVSTTAVNSGGSITSDGGAPVTARGVCWSTSQSPTTANSKTDNGTGTGTFNSSITGLTIGVTYYVRAYATNSAGTAYGNQQIANGLTADINSLVPQSTIDEIKRLGMPINTGVTPPTINGIYNVSQFVMKNSNISGDYANGSRFYDVRLRFSLQDNLILKLKVEYLELDFNGALYSSAVGAESFIVGSGKTFTVFVKVLATRTTGETADLVIVISGDLEANSINNLYYANFMIDNHGYSSVYMANGKGRVFYDLDGVSEKTTVFTKSAQIMTKGSSVILRNSDSK